MNNLHQGEVWVDRDGIVHRICDMDEDYRVNVINCLWQRVEKLHFIDDLRTIATCDVFGDPPDDVDLFSESHDEWFNSLPLVQALRHPLFSYLPQYSVELREEPKSELLRAAKKILDALTCNQCGQYHEYGNKAVKKAYTRLKHEVQRYER